MVENRDFWPRKGSSSEHYHKVRYRKARMVVLPDGKETSRICLLVSTEYMNVSDRQRDRQTPKRTAHDGTGRVYAWQKLLFSHGVAELR